MIFLQPEDFWGPIFFYFFNFLFIAILIYFLGVTMYLFNHWKKIPSLRLVFRVMVHGLKFFPAIFVHRLKMAPMRVRHALTKPTHPYPNYHAYPDLRIKRKRRFSKKRVRK